MAPVVRARASDQGEKSCERQLYYSREELKFLYYEIEDIDLSKKKSVCLITDLIRESGYNNSNMST